MSARTPTAGQQKIMGDQAAEIGQLRAEKNRLERELANSNTVAKGWYDDLQKARACYPLLLESEDLDEAILAERREYRKLMYEVVTTNVVGPELRAKLVEAVNEAQDVYMPPHPPEAA